MIALSSLALIIPSSPQPDYESGRPCFASPRNDGGDYFELVPGVLVTSPVPFSGWG